MSDITNGKVTGKKRLNRVGATPLFGGPSAQKFRGVAPTLTFTEKRGARQKGQASLLDIQKATSFSRSTDASPWKICDKCGSGSQVTLIRAGGFQLNNYVCVTTHYYFLTGWPPFGRFRKRLQLAPLKGRLEICRDLVFP
jgi:hypothetical protein